MGCSCNGSSVWISVLVAAGVVGGAVALKSGAADSDTPDDLNVKTVNEVVELGTQPEGEMDPMMAAWLEAGTPDEHHALLGAFVGEWTAHSVFQMSPDAPPMESTGSETNEMIFGGRYLATHHQGDFMGAPFEGRGAMGYDKVQKKYVGVWIDSMSTMIYVESGQYDAASRSFTMESAFTDPTGKKVKGRHVYTVVSDTERKLDFYEAEAGSDEWHKSGTITYTRK
jgi:Protein of unknown function (DUF1579)